jgi:DNA-binding NarL/FixJ family response regulator
MTPSELPSPDTRVGLLLSRDLIFTAKITGTARELNCRVLWADSPAQVSHLFELCRPRVVFVDLSAGELVRPDALMAYKQMAPTTPFVAFGSHVDSASLAGAAAAGCDPVLPRSRFVSTLPELIRSYLGADADE